jgi:cytochrome c oxidase assembly factor CtaG
MDAQPQEDSLDARLRDEASYIDDAGFTAAVVQKLPAQRQVRRSYRAGILLAVTLVAGVIAYLMSGGGSFIGEAVTGFVVMPLAVMYLCAIVASVLVMVFGVAVAMHKTGGQRLR